MARDLRAFYAAQRRLHEAADAEWEALSAAFGPFVLADGAEAWAAGLADDAFAWPAGGPARPAGQGVAAFAAGDGKRRAYAAPALCGAALRDGILVAPVPGALTTAFAHRHPEGEHETALGYGFEPEAARTLILHAGRAAPFETFETPAGTTDAAVAAHVLRVVVATLHGWRPMVRRARLVEAREA